MAILWGPSWLKGYIQFTVSMICSASIFLFPLMNLMLKESESDERFLLIKHIAYMSFYLLNLWMQHIKRTALREYNASSAEVLCEVYILRHEFSLAHRAAFFLAKRFFIFRLKLSSCVASVWCATTLQISQEKGGWCGSGSVAIRPKESLERRRQRNKLSPCIWNTFFISICLFIYILDYIQKHLHDVYSFWWNEACEIVVAEIPLKELLLLPSFN